MQYKSMLNILRSFIPTLISLGFLLPLNFAAGQNAVELNRTTDPRISLPADTGRFVRGRIDFSRYISPATCSFVGPSMRKIIDRGDFYDTLPYEDVVSLRVPLSSVQAVESCISEFDIDTLSRDQLRYAFDVALWIQNDSLMSHIKERWLTQSASIRDSSNILLYTILSFIKSSPQRLDLATIELSRLDSLGAPARLQRLSARKQFLIHWNRLFARDKIKEVAEDIISIQSSLEPEEMGYWSRDANIPFFSLLEVGLFDNPSGLPQILNRMRAELRIFGEKAGEPTGIVAMKFIDLPTKIGSKVNNIRADYLFSYNRDSNTSYPQLGKSLLVLVVSHDVPKSFYSDYAMIKRIREDYDTTKLDIVLIQKTKGSARWHTDGPLNPEREAEASRWYFQDYLKLEATVAVLETSFTKLPDGRMVAKPDESGIFGSPLIGTVIVDRNGNLVYKDIGIVRESVIRAYLGRL